MRNVIIATICLLLVIIIWFVVYKFSIKNTFDFFTENLENIKKLVEKGDYKSSKEVLDNISKEWKKTEKVWVYFVNQQDINDVDSQLKKIDMLIENEDKVMLLINIEELLSLIDMVDGNESMEIDNFF